MDIKMNIWEKFFFIVIAIVVSIAIMTLGSATFADTRIDYCKILWNKDSLKGYQLIGHRPWRSNDDILASNLETFEDAVGKAEQISCEIR
jgi:hypothetical protein